MSFDFFAPNCAYSSFAIGIYGLVFFLIGYGFGCFEKIADLFSSIKSEDNNKLNTETKK